MRSGKPICYTSADSVFQIAAHEETFGLERLYELCRIARRLCDPLAIGRVIARPFVGRTAADFARTSNRKDFSIPPLPDNLLQRAVEAGREVVSVGKIGDIFAHRFTGREIKGRDNAGNVDLALRALGETADGGFIFVNLVDFDSEYGHRRDVARLRRLPRGVRRAAAGDRSGDARRRFLRADRRPRQRPDLARQRPHPRARADPRLRRRRRAGADRRAQRASPTSPRPSRKSSACRRRRAA